jgi:hypothetical protein
MSCGNIGVRFPNMWKQPVAGNDLKSEAGAVFIRNVGKALEHVAETCNHTHSTALSSALRLVSKEWKGIHDNCLLTLTIKRHFHSLLTVLPSDRSSLVENFKPLANMNALQHLTVFEHCGLTFHTFTIFAILAELKSISLVDIWEEADEVLGFMRQCTNLTSIDLEGCGNTYFLFPYPPLPTYTHELSNTIIELSMRDCGDSQWFSSGLVDLSRIAMTTKASGYRGLRKLTHLDLLNTGIHRMELPGIYGLENLTHLELGLCIEQPCTTDDIITNLVAEHMPLEYLGLMGCNELTDLGLLDLGKLTTLCKIDVSHCTKLTRRGIISAFPTAPHQPLFISCYGCLGMFDQGPPSCYCKSIRLLWTMPQGITLDGGDWGEIQHWAWNFGCISYSLV